MTPVDLILWRSMVAAARRRTAHQPPPIAWQAGLGRLLRQVLRSVLMLPLRSQSVARRVAGTAEKE